MLKKPNFNVKKKQFLQCCDEFTESAAVGTRDMVPVMEVMRSIRNSR